MALWSAKSVGQLCMAWCCKKPGTHYSSHAPRVGQKPGADAANRALVCARSLGLLRAAYHWGFSGAQDHWNHLTGNAAWVLRLSYKPEVLGCVVLSGTRASLEVLSIDSVLKYVGIGIFPILDFTMLIQWLGSKAKYCVHFPLYLKWKILLTLCTEYAWGRGNAGNVHLSFRLLPMYLFILLCCSWVLWSHWVFWMLVKVI